MAQAFISRRGGKNAVKTMESILSDINYTGVMLSSLKEMDGKMYTLLVLETSGTLTVNGSYTGDIWLCGGGGSGANVAGGSNIGGGGGGGGYTTNVPNVAITSGAVAIGGNSTGNGGTTSYLTYTAAGGEQGYAGGSTNENAGRGGNGGSGGGGTLKSGTVQGTGGKGQGTSTRPFLCAQMPAYCAGGGASSISYTQDAITFYYHNGGNGGTDGGDGTQGNTSAPLVQGIGGEYGGGNGGRLGYEGASVSAATRYGCGGGSCVGAPGIGYPGCMMIRIEI